MKYTTKQYANSLLSALEGKSDKVQGETLQRFLGILARNGDAPKRNQIMAELKRAHLKKNKIHEVEVQMAANSPATLKKDLESALGKNILFKDILNPNILGGIKILIDDETLIDASVRTQLDRMFARIK